MLRKRRKYGNTLKETSQCYRVIITLYTDNDTAEKLEEAYEHSWDEMAIDLMWNHRLCPLKCKQAGVWAHGRVDIVNNIWNYPDVSGPFPSFDFCGLELYESWCHEAPHDCNKECESINAMTC